MPTVELTFECVLFDMDGTLIDSTPAVNQTWKEYIERFNLDGEYVMQHCHGCRTIENLRRFTPLSEEELPEEVKRFEGRIKEIALEDAKTNGPGQIVGLPGTKELLAQISSGITADPTRTRKLGWAIVTSATAAYGHGGFAAADVGPAPEVFVTSDLVDRGKPAPDPYLLGAKMTGSDPRKCLVVEDAPPGVVAGKAAGATVLGLKTTHDEKRMWESGADYVVKDLSFVQAKWEGPNLVVTIQSDAKPSGV